MKNAQINISHFRFILFNLKIFDENSLSQNCIMKQRSAPLNLSWTPGLKPIFSKSFFTWCERDFAMQNLNVIAVFRMFLRPKLSV